MTEQEQVNELWALQGHDHELEQELARAHVTRLEAYQGGGLHASDVYEVVLETGRLAYFKPANGLLNPVGKRALANYGHTPLSTTISECAAWQLAKQLGDSWHELVVPTALRFLTLPDGTRDVGALAVYRPGKEKQRGFLNAVADQVLSGAFFDALIGDQDRNDGNILWFEERQRIYLIDQGFAFATPGANSGELILTAWRARQGARELTGGELHVLSDLLENDLYELRRFVTPERIDALAARARRMVESRQMPLVGGF